MFKSRYTIAVSLIVLYFVPMLFLSLYGMNAMGPQKTWEFFSFGLFFAIAGTLILFSFMIHFETAIKSSETEDEYEEDSDTGESIEDLDAIIISLNEELNSKKQEAHYLARENVHLKNRVEEVQKELAQKQLDIQKAAKKEAEIPPAKATIIEAEVPSVKTTILHDVVEPFTIHLPIQKQEEPELAIAAITEEVVVPKQESPPPIRENRVEVTRL